MYSMPPFFVEINPEHIPGDGWTAVARFSRSSDYLRHEDVPKVALPTHMAEATRGAAERAATQWARAFVCSSSAVLESALRLKAGKH